MSTTIHRINITSGTIGNGDGTDTPVYWASCYCNAIRRGDGFYYSHEDAQKAADQHIMSIPASRIHTRLGVDGFWVMEERTEDEIATHADGSVCDRATTTRDCPLSHDYRAAGTYSPNDRAELTTALETLAASKSPTARLGNAREAHLLNARTARRILRELIERQDEFTRRDAERTDVNYLAWERDIMAITDLNRRALRK